MQCASLLGGGGGGEREAVEGEDGSANVLPLEGERLGDTHRQSGLGAAWYYFFLFAKILTRYKFSLSHT